MRIVMLVLAALALAVAAPAVADKGGNPNGGNNSGEERGNKGGGGKGGGGGGGGNHTSSLSLVLLDGATEARHGGRVTFEVSTTATDRPFVGLRCWQGTAFVYDGYVGYFEDYMYDRDWFTLDSPYWTPAVEATCTARLFSYDKRGNQDVLATVDFPVAP